MQLFYTTGISGDFATFDEVEARHCVQVLRKKLGDTIEFVDGEGGWYRGEIYEINKKKLMVKILEQKERTSLLPCQIHIAIAPTKNIDRMEWFLEKATEIGISSITPVLCEHSERKHIRPDRLKKIILSAMKQSLKAELPVLNELVGFQEFVTNNATSNVGQRFIAHCQKSNLPHLKNNCKPHENVTILIGPEGDFSPVEVDFATGKGFQEIGLGQSRLRTETAGIAAVFAVNFLNEPF